MPGELNEMRDKKFTKQQMAFEMLRRTGTTSFTRKDDGTCVSIQEDKQSGKLLKFNQISRNKFQEVKEDT